MNIMKETITLSNDKSLMSEVELNQNLICVGDKLFAQGGDTYLVTELFEGGFSAKCEWEKNNEPNTMLRGILNIIYQEGCNDLIFSGHTSMMVMSSLFLSYYCLNSPLANLLLIIYNIIGFIVIIGTRLHYSVDVFIASVVNVLLFFSFHKQR